MENEKPGSGSLYGTIIVGSVIIMISLYFSAAIIARSIGYLRDDISSEISKLSNCHERY